jgi:anaerobic selenocysteine-containing dehydrogenase
MTETTHEASPRRSRGIAGEATPDTVKTTTCYMCACRCGVRVTVRNGRVVHVEGNPDHPVNKGVLCGKGAAAVMQQASPARLRKPLKRVGERGKAAFVEIEWDEALSIAADWLGAIRATDPKKLAFFTGRDQSQALTGWWATQFGTPNFASHGGFCSVNMAAAGFYTIGGSFWEFGEPDWERTKYLLLLGVAEDHASNPIKAGLSALKARGAKVVSINPVRTGYSAVADEWIGVRPGADGMFVMALIHELIAARQVDLAYLARYTNAPWLVVDAPRDPDHGLFARDGDGRPLIYDRAAERLSAAGADDADPALSGFFALPDGRRARPSFALAIERFCDPAYSPDAVASRCGVEAGVIRRVAAEIADVAFQQTIEIATPWTDCAGRRRESFVGRPVSVYAMRGISAHSNGFQTCRAIHILQLLIGAIDCPGGFRFRPPYPKPAPPAQKPAGKATAPLTPLSGPPLGFVTAPEDLLIDAEGKPLRIDEAFSWEAPFAAHGLMQMAIPNAVAGEPYTIDTLLVFMANVAWNSSMNTASVMRMLTDRDEATGEYRIPHFIVSDAFFSETVAYADLVLPDTTFLERWDCISLLDRPISDADGVADSIRQPVVAPDRDVRDFQSALLDLGARLGLPGMIDADGKPKYPGGYADYLVRHERAPGIGPLAGWRGAEGESVGRGPPNSRQLDAYVANGCFWRYELPANQRFYKFANRDYLDFSASMGWITRREPIVMQLYAEPLQRFRLAAQGHGPIQPPDRLRVRLIAAMDPLPSWSAPLEDAEADAGGFPLHAITQRPSPMYHSWGSQNAWLRQIIDRNALVVSAALAKTMGLADGERVRIVSRNGAIVAPVKIMDGVQRDTVWTWNAIGKRRGAWNLAPDAPESREGFLLNHLIDERLPADASGKRPLNADPVTGQAAWYDLRVRIERLAERGHGSEPQFEAISPPVGLSRPPRRRLGKAGTRAR